MIVHPLIISTGQPDPVLQLPVAYAVLQARRWWALRGYFCEGAEPELLTLAVTVQQDNPLNDLMGALRDTGRTPTMEEPFLAFLAGWDGWYAGWGEPRGAVVGELVLRTLRTGLVLPDDSGRDAYTQAGSPNDIMDDRPAWGVTAHELGHVFGLAHQDEPDSIMAQSGACYRFPDDCTLPPEYIRRPQAELQAMRLAAARPEPVGCRLNRAP